MLNQDLVGQAGRARDLCGPALILDRTEFARNIDTMAHRCAAAGIRLRPHAKTHKSSHIAKVQMASGACGICCATAHEVIVMARMGVSDVLLTSPLAEPRKMRAVLEAARHTALGVVVDHPHQVEMWEDAVGAAGGTLRVLVDIDIGMHRTGAAARDAVALARRVHASPVLRYDGVQAYSGMVQHIASYEQRKVAYTAQLGELFQVVAALRENGLAPNTVSGGGTGTAEIDLELQVFTELQAGSYVFMDVEYQAVELTESEPNPYAPALFLRASIISVNVPGQVTLNAGFKSLSTDGPTPVPRCTQPTQAYAFFGDEYGRVSGAGLDALRLGEPYDLVVPHCDPTVNLHDVYHVLEGDTLADIWRIDARGSL